VRYVAPKQGAQLAFDMLAIPTDAPHPENAERFINFILQPDVMADITNAVSYPNAIPASDTLIHQDILDDPAIYPPAAVQKQFFTIDAVPQTAQRARTRMWARFKAGQ
jgi:putrescine transport system substrate-binding protein